MKKNNAKKPLALDINTVRALSGTDFGGRVVGGYVTSTNWRCGDPGTVSGNSNCCGSNEIKGCVV